MRTTTGILADLHSPRGVALITEAAKRFPNRDFHEAIKLAHELKKRYLVAAGRLDVVCSGCIISLSDDESGVLFGATIANSGMAEVGSSTTAWLVGGDNGLEERAEAVMRKAGR